MNEAMIVVLGIGALGVVLLAPIVALVVAYGARTKAHNTEALLRTLENRLTYLESWAYRAGTREPASGTGSDTPATPAPAAGAAAPPATDPRAESSVTASRESVAAPSPTSPAAPAD